MPGKVRIETEVERIALIVIDRRKSRRDVEDQAAGDRRSGLGDLIGVGEMELAPMPEIRRMQCKLPALNHGVGPGDGPENIRLANVVVVEPVVGAGFVVVSAEHPTPQRNRDAYLPFDIAFTAQGNEPTKSLLVGKSLQLARRRGKRRRLVEVAVEPAERPVQMGNSDRGAEARISRVLGDRWQR